MAKTTITWMCKTHDIQRLWVTESDTVCLQCAVEQLGWEETTRLLQEELKNANNAGYLSCANLPR